MVDAYAVSLAALILTAGALADRYGRRLVFATGIVLFTVASFLCGIAWNVAALDVARALQGVGGAALFATALALIGAEYEGPARMNAIAIWGSTVGFAVACGPLLGGIITDSLSWRWIFFVNIPVGAFALALTLREVRESRDPQARRADVGGLITFAAALFLIVFGLLRGNDAGWGSAQILGALLGGAALLVVFLVIERLQERPMLDVSLFRRPADIFGMALHEHRGWTVLLAGFVVTGVGIGLANPTIAGAALRVVDPARTGMASGISNTCRLGGLAVGVAILGVLLQHRIGDHLAAAGYHGKAVSAAVASSGLRAAAGNPRLGRVADVAFVSGLHLIFLTGCLALLVGAGASLLVRSRRAEATKPAPAAAS